MTRRGLAMMIVHLIVAAPTAASHAAEPASDDQAGNTAAMACEPACEPGQTCVDGVCLVPVPRQQGQPAYQTFAAAYPPRAAATAAPTVEPRQRGFLVLPFIGVHSHRNVSGRDPGARLGSFLGGRLNETVSLSGQLTIDISNVNTSPGYSDVTETAYDMAFSPLFHVPAGTAEIVLGPKVGVFSIQNDARFGDTVATASLSGLSAGINAGVFFPISRTTLLGVMASYELRKIGELCRGISGQAEGCSTDVEVEAIRMASLTGGALF